MFNKHAWRFYFISLFNHGDFTNIRLKVFGCDGTVSEQHSFIARHVNNSRFQPNLTLPISQNNIKFIAELLSDMFGCGAGDAARDIGARCGDRASRGAYQCTRCFMGRDTKRDCIKPCCDQLRNGATLAALHNHG